MPQRKPARIVPRRQDAARKLFVLDTNVLMHDPTSLFQFQEHDVYVPMAILEELDGNKKGVSEVARNARQASRFLEELVADAEHEIERGIPLDSRGNRAATGCLFLQTEAIDGELLASVADIDKVCERVVATTKQLRALTDIANDIDKAISYGKDVLDAATSALKAVPA